MTRKNNNSFELLLDTICNTFGGVLFITMLLAVLLQVYTDRPPSEEPDITASQYMAIAVKHKQLKERLEDVKVTLGQQAELVDKLASPEAIELCNELHASVQKYADLSEQKLEILEQIRQTEASLATAQAEEAELSIALDELEKQTKQLSIRLKTAVDAHTRDESLPQMHSSYKDKVVLVVKYDRLYTWHKYDNYGERLGLNTDEFVVVSDEGTFLDTEPIPYAGIPITASAQADIRDRLRQYRRFNCNYDVLLWPDSYDSFPQVKAAIANTGAEYTLWLEPGVVDRGGTSKPVQ